MIARNQGKDHRGDAHRDRPSHGDIVESCLQNSCKEHQHSLSEDGGDAVEGAADADIE